MKKKIGAVAAAIVIFTAVSAVGAEDLKLWVDPEAVFLHQTTPVRFKLKLGRLIKNPIVTLLKVHENLKDEKLARMRDDGREGDEKADDGHFTCVLELSPKHIEVLRFKCLVEYLQSSTKRVSEEVKVEVVECPE